jgi:uncharacterized protein (TIGR00299 family) protein
MAKIAYWDCQAGIAGDMCLGALVSAGVPLAYLQEIVDKLHLHDRVRLSAETVKRCGHSAIKVQVEAEAEPKHHRHLRHIKEIIDRSPISEYLKQKSLDTFTNLAIAEGQVHGISPEQVHFHEVGAVDAIVDIVGTWAGLEYLGIQEIYCSPLPTGGGSIECDHGVMPVPAPAVLALYAMGKVPLFSNGIQKELVTPTGAVLAITTAQKFGGSPSMTLETIGVGAGSRDLPIPNILRLWIGSSVDLDHNYQQETVAVLETQVDESTPQTIAFVMDLLLQAGALDVFTQPVVMKKSRLGVLITVICPPELAESCQTILFRETTTLGIRHRHQSRSRLSREIRQVTTKYGQARVKIAPVSDGYKIQPEYDDCVQLAQLHGVSFEEIWTAVKLAGQT